MAAFITHLPILAFSGIQKARVLLFQQHFNRREMHLDFFFFCFVPTCCSRRPSDHTFLWLLGDVRENQNSFLSPPALPKRWCWSPHLFPVSPPSNRQLNCPNFESVPRFSLHPSSGERKQGRFQIYNQIIT